jgi:hypothetical protein
MILTAEQNQERAIGRWKQGSGYERDTMLQMLKAQA